MTVPLRAFVAASSHSAASGEAPVAVSTPTSRTRARRPSSAALSAARDLLVAARRGVAEACLTTVPTERYAAAHLAALRCAAAVLAARTRPEERAVRSRPRSAWALLPQVAPELAEWAAFFAAGAGKRAAAEAGLSRAVQSREADDLLRDAETFLALVETTLGLPHQGVLPAGDDCGGVDCGGVDSSAARSGVARSGVARSGVARSGVVDASSPPTPRPVHPVVRLVRGQRSG